MRRIVRGWQRIASPAVKMASFRRSNLRDSIGHHQHARGVLGRVIRRLPMPTAMTAVQNAIYAAVSHNQDRSATVPMFAVRAESQLNKGLLRLSLCKNLGICCRQDRRIVGYVWRVSPEKSYPRIAMVQARQDWRGDNRAGSLDRSG